VRRLVETGLGTPARVLLRVLVETLLAIILLGARRELITEFQASQSPEETRRFWSRYLRSRNLNDELARIEEELEPRLAGLLVQALSDWRAESFERLSAVVHPTFLASTMNYFPDLMHGDTSSGLLGSSSINRVPVLDEATKWLWCFSLFALPVLFVAGPDRPPIYELQRDNEIDQAVWVGARVLRKLLLDHWDDIDQYRPQPTDDPT